MDKDIGLDSAQYSVILVVFFGKLVRSKYPQELLYSDMTETVGYVVFEPPSNMILVRTKPSIYLPIIMAIWVSPWISSNLEIISILTSTLIKRAANLSFPQGVLTCLMALAQTYQQLIVLRIFVGVLESGFAPGILLIISSWYKRNEQSRRFAVYMSAAILSGAFGGLLGGAITGGLEGAHGIRGWRYVYSMLLLNSLFFAFFLSFFFYNSCTIGARLRS